MGNIYEFPELSLSRQLTAYSSQQEQSRVWAGRYLVLSDPKHSTSLLKKTIYLRSHKEAKQLVQ
jgi:hypothetical protein